MSTETEHRAALAALLPVCPTCAAFICPACVGRDCRKHCTVALFAPRGTPLVDALWPKDGDGPSRSSGDGT